MHLMLISSGQEELDFRRSEPWALDFPKNIAQYLHLLFKLELTFQLQPEQY